MSDPRRQVLGTWSLRAFLWTRLPLAAFSGLRVTRLDDEACEVALPGGWRTRNPFGSTYFAAQLMAAEMSTGAPALVLAREAPASVALIVVSVGATYSRRLVGAGRFRFDDVAGMRSAVAAAAQGEAAVPFTARPVGRDAAGDEVGRFEISWSFKRRVRA